MVGMTMQAIITKHASADRLAELLLPPLRLTRFLFLLWPARLLAFFVAALRPLGTKWLLKEKRV